MVKRSNSAMREVTSKSDAEIECATAKKWAARAIACYKRYAKTRSERWLVRAAEYRHEALEHAAAVGDYGRFVGVLQRAMDRAIGSSAITDPARSGEGLVSSHPHRKSKRRSYR